MASSRTWNLRLNLDEFNALVASLYADADRALALQGMTLGANGGALPEGTPSAFSRGWELGHRMHDEAQAFQAAQAERGRASAEKRRERTGSAQPQRGADRSGSDPAPEPPFEPPFEPAPEPNHNPQSSIEQSTNDNRVPPVPPRGKRAPRGAFVPPSVDEAKAFAGEIGFADVERWFDHYRSNGWKVGKVPMVDWRACMRNWSKDRFGNGSRGGPPAVRKEGDAAWVARNAGALKPYTPKPGESHGPAF